MIDYTISTEDRLVQTGDVYWAVLSDISGEQQRYVQDALKDDHLAYWAHPTDRQERTRTAMDYKDSLTLLVGEEETGIIGYDTSFPVTEDRLEEMYSTRIADMLSPLAEEQETELVYHMVLHPEFRGEGYGVKTAFLRQHLLEHHWDTDAADMPETYYTRVCTDPGRDTFRERVRQLTDDDLDYPGPDPDTVISFPRRYETPADRDSETLSRAYRISQGFGFEDCDRLLNGGNDTFIIRADPKTYGTPSGRMIEAISDTAVVGQDGRHD